MNTPMINENKHQPVMPAPVSVTAPIERENTQLLESEQQNKDKGNGAEPTPEQLASPQGAEDEESDAMNMENNRPSTVQLKGETEETLKEPTPSQSSNEGGYDE